MFIYKNNEIGFKTLHRYNEMSWFNRISSNVLNGTSRQASAVIPGCIQRRLADLGNWIYYVGPEQTPRVFNEIVEHVRANYPPPTPAPLSVPEPPRL